MFFAAMLHSQFVPVATMPQNWLGLGHAVLCRSHDWTVVNHYYTQNWGLPYVFCGNAALTVCAAHCGHYAPKLARSWPCSFCAEVMIGLW